MTITATTNTTAETLPAAPTATTSTQEMVESPRSGRAARRTFSAEYKRRIVAEYEQAPAGSKGQVLRREGLYDSSVTQWRAQIEAGTLGRVSKRKPRAGQSPEQARIAELEKQIGKLEADSVRKDQVIADRDAALEVLGKGAAFLEALSKKNLG